MEPWLRTETTDTMARTADNPVRLDPVVMTETPVLVMSGVVRTVPTDRVTAAARAVADTKAVVTAELGRAAGRERV